MREAFFEAGKGNIQHATTTINIVYSDILSALQNKDIIENMSDEEYQSFLENIKINARPLLEIRDAYIAYANMFVAK